jgi:hypothetical protein
MGLNFSKSACIGQEKEIIECENCNYFKKLIYEKLEIIRDLNYLREINYKYITKLENKINEKYNEDY